MTSRHAPAEHGANQPGLRTRVGLTRHCVNSGVITLPFALQDTLPEGEFSVADAETGTNYTVRVASGRPRRMHGLLAFMQAYELKVNDRIEIFVGEDGQVRLRAERKATGHAAPQQQETPASAAGGSRSVQSADAVHPSLKRASAEAQGLPGGTVVERIGNVTVRRLHARPSDYPSEATLANADDIERALAARNAELEAEQATFEDMPPELGGLDDAYLLSDASASAFEPAEPSESDEPAQGGLFAGAGEAQAQALGASNRPGEKAEPPAVADGRRSDREEALSQAGDLRSQMLRWFTRPDVPVIVPFERLMQEFNLTRDVVADVVAGIVDDAPEGLSLTLIREGTLRVTQAEVASDASHQRAS